MKQVCSEGAVNVGSFGSPEKCNGMRRKMVVTDDFDKAVIRGTVHVRSIQQSKFCCKYGIIKKSTL